MAVALNDVIRCTARWAIGNISIGNNVFYYRVAALGADNGDSTVMTALKNQLVAMYAEIEPNTSDQVAGIEILFYNMTQDRPLGSESFSSFAGTAAGHMLPPGVAALILGRTLVKKCVGKKFLPPATEGENDGGSWSAGYKTTLDSFGGMWLEQVDYSDSGSLIPCLFRASTGQKIDFQSFLTSLAPAYQRRRRN